MYKQIIEECAKSLWNEEKPNVKAIMDEHYEKVKEECSPLNFGILVAIKLREFKVPPTPEITDCITCRSRGERYCHCR